MHRFINNVLILVLLIVLLLSGCKKDEGLVYLRDESNFGTFNIENNKVYFYNNLKIKNYDKEDYSFKIIIDASIEGDLVKGDTLSVYHSDNLDNDIFTIKANEEKEFPIVAIGEKGEGQLKKDRLPPEAIIIEIVE
ncbi:MAG: hypothetical protein N4A50_08930 [Vallitalea sp.]|jgi:hypothetical protein|nr:hypothetical protein [Vallitalea sp.]